MESNRKSQAGVKVKSKTKCSQSKLNWKARSPISLVLPKRSLPISCQLPTSCGGSQVRCDGGVSEKNMKINELLTSILNNDMVLPEFQREYVWGTDQAIQLLREYRRRWSPRVEENSSSPCFLIKLPSKHSNWICAIK